MTINLALPTFARIFSPGDIIPFSFRKGRKVAQSDEVLPTVEMDSRSSFRRQKLNRTTIEFSGTRTPGPRNKNLAKEMVSTEKARGNKRSGKKTVHHDSAEDSHLASRTQV